MHDGELVLQTEITNKDTDGRRLARPRPTISAAQKEEHSPAPHYSRGKEAARKTKDLGEQQKNANIYEYPPGTERKLGGERPRANGRLLLLKQRDRKPQSRMWDGDADAGLADPNAENLSG